MISSKAGIECWAKTDAEGRPGISVRDHCLNVGCVAEALLQALPNPKGHTELAVWLAACHDIGKISPGFQSKCMAWLHSHGLITEAQTWAWTEAERDHSKVSQFTLQHLLKQKYAVIDEMAAIWAAVSGMHHGRPHWQGEWNPAAKSGIPLEDDWDASRRALATEMGAIFGEPQSVPSLDSSRDPALWAMAGLITVADWIGSDETHFSPLRSEAPADPAETRARAASALQQIGFRLPEIRRGLEFDEIFGFAPNDLQQATLEMIQQPGVYVIEAPMGMGKTEAALAAAYQLIAAGHARGLYFALPTQATSNRIHERVGTFLSKLSSEAPRLVHSGSWLVDQSLPFPALSAGQPKDQDQRRDSRDWFASSKRALLASFGVGTVDQALMGVIAVKHFFVRHFALAGKVVVLDEVHSYDVFTGALLEALVESLSQLGCTVIILSATLTAERRERLLSKAMRVTGKPRKLPTLTGPEPFPLLSGVVDRQPIPSRAIAPPPAKPPVAIRFRPEPDALSEAVAAARAGACVLWICNTVDKAQATYRAMCSERCEGDPPVGLLHSRFPFFRRQELEQEWMAALGKDRKNHRPPGCLLISTQIVEQSVDLDADLLVTELAPTDMLFQRLGRLWRHEWRDDEKRPLKSPEVWILQESVSLEELTGNPAEKEICRALGKKAKVYAPYVLLRTLEIWSGQSEVRIPADIRPWLEATYAARNEDERPAWKTLLEQLSEKRKAHAGQAFVSQNVWNLGALKDEEGIGTRLNECPTVPLVLVQEIGRDTLTLLDGSTVPIQTNYFDYKTAKALHRNVVKAPAYWLAHKDRFLKGLPAASSAMIAKYIHGRVEAGLVCGACITAESLDTDTKLGLHPSIGLAKEGNVATPRSYWTEDDDDESYD